MLYTRFINFEVCTLLFPLAVSEFQVLMLMFLTHWSWVLSSIPLYADIQSSWYQFWKTVKTFQASAALHNVYTGKSISPKIWNCTLNSDSVAVYIGKRPMNSPLLPAFFDTIPSQFKGYLKERGSWTSSHLHPRRWPSELPPTAHLTQWQERKALHMYYHVWP